MNKLNLEATDLQELAVQADAEDDIDLMERYMKLLRKNYPMRYLHAMRRANSA